MVFSYNNLNVVASYKYQLHGYELVEIDIDSIHERMKRRRTC